MADSGANVETNEAGKEARSQPKLGRETGNDSHTSPLTSEVRKIGEPLYPQVQRAMDNLKRITLESDLKRITSDPRQPTDIPHTPLGEPILSPDMVQQWVKEEGFGNGKRNTYHNPDTYLYIKGCNIVENEADTDQTIATARHLTSLGAIHPESQWGVYKVGDKYQMFVVSPKLEPWLLDEDLSGEYDNRPNRPMPDQSHLQAWFKRIDHNFVPGQPIPEDSLLYHLNWTEASNYDNWGWDARGEMFPVDVEVLHPSKPFFKDREPWKPKNIDLEDIDLI